MGGNDWGVVGCKRLLAAGCAAAVLGGQAAASLRVAAATLASHLLCPPPLTQPSHALLPRVCLPQVVQTPQARTVMVDLVLAPFHPG